MSQLCRTKSIPANQSDSANDRELIEQLLTTRQQDIEIMSLNRGLDLRAGSNVNPAITPDSQTGLNMRDFFVALREFMLLFPPVEIIHQQQSPTTADYYYTVRHQCTSQCQFHIYKGTLYICKRTGNFHVCNAIVCDQLQQCSENKVCDLTALSYPLDPVSDFESTGNNKGVSYQEYMRNFSRSKNPTTITTTYRNPNGIIRRKIPRSKENISSQSTVVIENTPPQSKRLKVCRNNNIDTNSLLMQAHNLMHKLFPNHQAAEELQVLGKVCVSLWCRVTNSNTYAESSEQYRFEYHMLAVLYEMMHGFCKKETVIIDRNAFVCANMPDKKNVQKLLGMNKKNDFNLRMITLTSTGKQLRRCLGEAV